MTTVEEAVLAIRHVVQEHGDQHTRLGSPAHLDGVHWFGHLLGWIWPHSYVGVLAKHDGVLVQDAILFSFTESIERFLFHVADWHRPDGYWPIAGDGCGNYFAITFHRASETSECPVVFFESTSSTETPVCQVATSYAEFVTAKMYEQCEGVGCSLMIPTT